MTRPDTHTRTLLAEALAEVIARHAEVDHAEAGILDAAAFLPAEAAAEAARDLLDLLALNRIALVRQAAPPPQPGLPVLAEAR